MNEVYWIAGGSIPLTDRETYPQAVLAWISSEGLRPAWINEVQWLSLPEKKGAAPRWPARLAVFTWQSQPTLDHALLQAASQAILSGERDLVLLGDEGEDRADLLVLASPQATGRYNLLPRARLSARFSLPGESEPVELAEELAPRMKKLELESSHIGMLATCGETSRLGTGIPASWTRLDPAPGCAVSLCNALVPGLEKTGIQAAVLASLPACGPTLVTLVEKV